MFIYHIIHVYLHIHGLHITECKYILPIPAYHHANILHNACKATCNFFVEIYDIIHLDIHVNILHDTCTSSCGYIT